MLLREGKRDLDEIEDDEDDGFRRLIGRQDWLQLGRFSRMSDPSGTDLILSAIQTKDVLEIDNGVETDSAIFLGQKSLVSDTIISEPNHHLQYQT